MAYLEKELLECESDAGVAAGYSVVRTSRQKPQHVLKSDMNVSVSLTNRPQPGSTTSPLNETLQKLLLANDQKMKELMATSFKQAAKQVAAVAPTQSALNTVIHTNKALDSEAEAFVTKIKAIIGRHDGEIKMVDDATTDMQTWLKPLQVDVSALGPLLTNANDALSKIVISQKEILDLKPEMDKWATIPAALLTGSNFPDLAAARVQINAMNAKPNVEALEVTMNISTNIAYAIEQTTALDNVGLAGISQLSKKLKNDVRRSNLVLTMKEVDEMIEDAKEKSTLLHAAIKTAKGTVTKLTPSTVKVQAELDKLTLKITEATDVLDELDAEMDSAELYYNVWADEWCKTAEDAISALVPVLQRAISSDEILRQVIDSNEESKFDIEIRNATKSAQTLAATLADSHDEKEAQPIVMMLSELKPPARDKLIAVQIKLDQKIKDALLPCVALTKTLADAILTQLNNNVNDADTGISTLDKATAEATTKGLIEATAAGELTKETIVAAIATAQTACTTMKDDVVTSLDFNPDTVKTVGGTIADIQTTIIKTTAKKTTLGDTLTSAIAFRDTLVEDLVTEATTALSTLQTLLTEGDAQLKTPFAVTDAKNTRTQLQQALNVATTAAETLIVPLASTALPVKTLQVAKEVHEDLKSGFVRADAILIQLDDAIVSAKPVAPPAIPPGKPTVQGSAPAKPVAPPATPPGKPPATPPGKPNVQGSAKAKRKKKKKKKNKAAASATDAAAQANDGVPAKDLALKMTAEKLLKEQTTLIEDQETKIEKVKLVIFTLNGETNKEESEQLEGPIKQAETEKDELLELINSTDLVNQKVKDQIKNAGLGQAFVSAATLLLARSKETTEKGRTLLEDLDGSVRDAEAKVRDLAVTAAAAATAAAAQANDAVSAKELATLLKEQTTLVADQETKIEEVELATSTFDLERKKNDGDTLGDLIKQVKIQRDELKTLIDSTDLETVLKLSKTPNLDQPLLQEVASVLARSKETTDRGSALLGDLDVFVKEAETKVEALATASDLATTSAAAATTGVAVDLTDGDAGNGPVPVIATQNIKWPNVDSETGTPTPPPEQGNGIPSTGTLSKSQKEYRFYLCTMRVINHDEDSFNRLDGRPFNKWLVKDFDLLYKLDNYSASHSLPMMSEWNKKKPTKKEFAKNGILSTSRSLSTKMNYPKTEDHGPRNLPEAAKPWPSSGPPNEVLLPQDCGSATANDFDNAQNDFFFFTETMERLSLTLT